MKNVIASLFLIVASLMVVPKVAQAEASIGCIEESNGVYVCNLLGSPALASAMTWYGPPVIAQLDDSSHHWIVYGPQNAWQVEHQYFVCATSNDEHLAPQYDTVSGRWAQTVRTIVVKGTVYPPGGGAGQDVSTTIQCRGAYPESPKTPPANPDYNLDTIWIWVERPTFPSDSVTPNGWDNIWCVLGAGGDGSYSGGGYCPGGYSIPPYSPPN